MKSIKHLKKHFFNTEFVKYKVGLEGMTVSDTGTIIMGNKAGPLYFSIKNLCHEMSHMVEINDERMRMRGWGLKIPEVWVYDRMCREPTQLIK